jgi:plasmid stabilization system protein ParE
MAWSDEQRDGAACGVLPGVHRSWVPSVAQIVTETRRQCVAPATMTELPRGLGVYEIVAYHQAGHAVVAVLLQGGLLSVRIPPMGATGCCRLSRRRGRSAWCKRRDARITAAGVVAVLRAAGMPLTQYGEYTLRTGRDPYYVGGDFARLGWIAESVDTVDCLRWAREQYYATDQMLARAHAWAAVEAVAKALLMEHRLTGREVGAIVRDIIRAG